jgi:hypothetical protein
MINACNINNFGFYIFDYDTRVTSNGFSHEIATGHLTTKRGFSVSAIHGSTSIIGDYDDSRMELYLAPYTQSTGTFPKYFIPSNN